MCVGHSQHKSEEQYYDCTDCAYRSPVEVGIGLCPRCGTSLAN